MKKKIIGLLCVVACWCMCGCGDYSLVSDSFETPHCHMVVVESVGMSAIYVHEETGVMYFHNTNHGGFCPMIKADGTAYTIEDFNADKISE